MKPRRRLIVALIITGLLLLGLVGVGTYGLLRPSKPSAMPPGTRAVTATPPVPTGAAALKPIVHTSSSIKYADSIVQALFTWNTTSGLQPEDFESIISEDADPSGIETSALVDDLAAYFPTDTQWQQLRDYRTAETVTLQRAYIPVAWGQAMASDPSAVRPGTTAVTIEAVRHRTGTWYGATAATSDPVSLTVFVTCQPTFARCHILRLSGLNTPLK